ncbi:MAG: M23 family metallopeptidase [Chloroflexota bacterium]
MHTVRDRLQTWVIFLVIFGIIIVMMLGFVFLSGTVGVLLAPTQILETPLLVSPIPTIDGTPIARFAELDPAIIDVLDQSPSNYGNQRLDSSGIQPIGIYLPRSGDVQFEILAPTALPTPLPFPTSPPLPVPPLAVLPTVPLAPTDAETGESSQARIVPYSAGNCAPSGLPVDGILTQRYHRYHSGIDIGIPLNTPVIATHSGQVTFADWSTVGYGYLVIIENSDFITYYAHNTSFNVNSGDFVGKGSIVAWSGSTGNSTGPHVHYETRINDIPVDPLTFSSRGYSTC